MLKSIQNIPFVLQKFLYKIIMYLFTCLKDIYNTMMHTYGVQTAYVLVLCNVILITCYFVTPYFVETFEENETDNESESESDTDTDIDTDIDVNVDISGNTDSMDENDLFVMTPDEANRDIIGLYDDAAKILKYMKSHLKTSHDKVKYISEVVTDENIQELNKEMDEMQEKYRYVKVYFGKILDDIQSIYESGKSYMSSSGIYNATLKHTEMKKVVKFAQFPDDYQEDLHFRPDVNQQNEFYNTYSVAERIQFFDSLHDTYQDLLITLTRLRDVVQIEIQENTEQMKTSTSMSMAMATTTPNSVVVSDEMNPQPNNAAPIETNTTMPDTMMDGTLMTDMSIQ